MKGWTIQRLPYPGIHPIISLQTMTPLHTLARFYRKDPDIAVSSETTPVPSKHVSGCSQSTIGWITGPPMEELEKVSKELKRSATLQVQQHYELALDSSCICIKRWPSRPSLEREAHWTCKLYMPQYRQTPGPKSGCGSVGELWRGYGGLLGQHWKCK